MLLGEEFRAWLKEQPLEITSDALWRCTAYRLATFLADRSWSDVELIASDRRTASLADQVYRAIGSIGANYAEAYSRRSAKDRCRFYEYSLGSAREARDWLLKVRRVLGEERTRKQLSLLTSIIRLLTITIVRERRAIDCPPHARRKLRRNQDH